MARFTTLQQVREEIDKGNLSYKQLVQHYLDQIRQTEDLNIYIEVYQDEALQQANLLDEHRKAGTPPKGRLAGMVLAIKDVLCYENHKVSAGSRILENYTSPFSATAIQRLLAEGVIIIGRVNCDEFAMGSSNENSAYGPTRNGIDPTKVPGGSSGASAVAVERDTCLAALGTDTGGSVRQPAAFCGTIGFKPSYGRISRYGLLAYGSSFDQIGILANSIEDTALLLEIMAGPDEYDSTASELAVPSYSQQLNPPEKVKIAYFETALEHPSLDIEVKKACYDLIDQLKKKGHEVAAVPFEYIDYIIPAYYVLTTAEASSNLSRYDGIRFGYRHEEASDLISTYKKSRTAGFGEEVRRRIMLGTFVLSSGYYDAYYTKAQKVRRLIQEKTFEIFKNQDFILMPAAPGTAWSIGEKINDPVEMYLADIFTVQANMAGIPAVSLPVGKHSNGLPIGVQFMANQFEESTLLAFSKYLMDIV